MTRLTSNLLVAALVAVPAVLAIGTGVAHAQPAAPHSAEPTTPEGWFKLGSDHYNLGEFEEAIDAFKKGFALETVASKKAAYLYNIAQAYRVKKDCPNTVFFYKRFLEFKDQDTAKPLPADKRAEVQKWIDDGEACVKASTANANKSPTSLTNPDPTVPDPTVGTVDPDGDGDGDDDHVDAPAGSADHLQPTKFSARLVGGLAIVKAGSVDLSPSGGGQLIAGYPIPVGARLTVEAGVGLSFASLSVNQPGGGSASPTLFAGMANVGLTYQLTSKLAVRGDLGLGVLVLGGATMTDLTAGAETTGALAMPHVRVGVSADFAFTKNFVGTLMPFAFGYSPAKDGLAAKSITAIDVMLGVGYRM